jgi:hypothetical protein
MNTTKPKRRKKRNGSRKRPEKVAVKESVKVLIRYRPRSWACPSVS